MKPTKIHLVYIPFTGVGLFGGFRGNEWLEKRIEIFKQYTLKSLLNQTDKNFVTWISFRPQEKTNKLVKELEIYLDALQFPFIFTFDGLMYADDRFFPRFRDRIPFIKRTLRGFWRAKKINWFALWDICKDKNASLNKRLKNSLGILRPHFQAVDFVYMTRIDSDDMFRKDVIEKIKEVSSNHKAITIRNGYVFNRITRQLAEWNPTTNPPFHTIIFPYNVFFDAEKYLEYMGGYRTHEDVVRLYDYYPLEEKLYCVLTHDVNISTTFTHRFRGEEWKEKEEIFSSFGI